MTYITLFFSDCGYYPHFVDLQVLRILSTFSGYIRILWISWIYLRFVDIICIDRIASYLGLNVHPIFHSYSSSVSDRLNTWTAFWEEKFTPVIMTSCGRRNVRKHTEIKNGEQYTDLDVYLNLYFLDKREVTSSEPSYYVVR